MSAEKIKVSELDIDITVRHGNNDVRDFSELLETTINQLSAVCVEMKTSIIPNNREDQNFTEYVQISRNALSVGEISFDEHGNMADGCVGCSSYFDNESVAKLDKIIENIKDSFDIQGVDILQGNWNNIECITIEKDNVTFSICTDGNDDDD